MKVFQVGGSVRDQLLGLTPRDFDYVITEASHEELLKLGFQDVGKGHRVYLHPDSKEEYSLSPDLYSDLARRDLTINAMALDDGHVIDYFGGMDDLRKHCLRHIHAQNFFTDPLRVYRVARFKAQFPSFTIHPDTIELMKKIKLTEAFHKLDPERIFGELKKALLVKSPLDFFKTLLEVEILDVHMSEISRSDLGKLEEISSRTTDPLLRFAGLCIPLDSSDVKLFCERLKVPNEWRDAGLVISEVNRYRDFKDVSNMLDFFYKIDAFRKPFNIEIVTAVFPSQKAALENGFRKIKDVSVKDIPQGLSGKDIAEAIRARRLAILNQHQDKAP